MTEAEAKRLTKLRSKGFTVELLLPPEEEEGTPQWHECWRVTEEVSQYHALLRQPYREFQNLGISLLEHPTEEVRVSKKQDNWKTMKL